MFIITNFKNFPRLFSTHKPNTVGYFFFHKKLFSQFIQHIEAKAIQFLILNINYKETKINMHNDIAYLKIYIPEECRICNFFLHMIVVRDMTQYGSHANPHFDMGDIITALFHVVDNTTKGGSINFYGDLDEKN